MKRRISSAITIIMIAMLAMNFAWGVYDLIDTADNIFAFYLDPRVFFSPIFIFALLAINDTMKEKYKWFAILFILAFIAFTTIPLWFKYTEDLLK